MRKKALKKTRKKRSRGSPDPPKLNNVGIVHNSKYFLWNVLKILKNICRNIFSSQL